MKNNRQKWLSVLFLFTMVLVLAVANYKRGAFLTGWDNLQTELNPLLGIKRAFFAVWQEYQSFGLVSGMAHAADLVRAIVVWILSLLLPTSLVRYTLIMSLLFLGAVGMYFLLAQAGLKKRSALVGSVFYCFNIATVQIFFLPYDPFVIFLSALPWLLLTLFIYLEAPRRRNLALLLVANFLATPSFYVQTLFMVYVLGIFILLAIHFFSQKKRVWRTAATALFVVLLVNMYWLLPQLYFLATGVSHSSQAIVNLYSSGTVFLQNLLRGGLLDFLLMRGYYLDLYGFNGQPLFRAWHSFSGSIFGIFAYVCLTATVVIGLWKGKNRHKPYFWALFLMTFLTLAIDVPIIKEFNYLLRALPIVGQILRSPFSKFVYFQVVAFTYFFALGFEFLTELSKKYLREMSLFFILLSLIMISLPSFGGQFISPELKVRVPSEYRELAREFTAGKYGHGRIAIFPENNFWGWYKNRWGYIGSGFWWYALEEPIVARTFDVWSKYSENYYWEFSLALEREDANLLNKVFQKYDIAYLLVDNSLAPNVGSYKSLQFERLKKLIKLSEQFTMIRKNGALELYAYENKPISASIKTVGPLVETLSWDVVYNKFGTYYTEPNIADNEYLFPFLELNSNNLARMRSQVWRENGDYYLYSNFSGADTFGTETLKQNHNYWYSSKNQRFNVLVWNEVKRGGNALVKVPRVELKPDSISQGAENCGRMEGQVGFDKSRRGVVSLTAQGAGKACFGYYFYWTPVAESHLLSVKVKELSGYAPVLYVRDNTKDVVLLNTKLKTGENIFFLPGGFAQSYGLTVAIELDSDAKTESLARIEELTLSPFPVTDVQAIRLSNKPPGQSPQKVFKFTTMGNVYWSRSAHFNPPAKGSMLFYLPQAFDRGWVAYTVPSENFLNKYLPFVFGNKLSKHVVVNNWANGWSLSSDLQCSGQCSIVVLFWPQYLEFFGLLLIPLAFAIVALWPKAKKN